MRMDWRRKMKRKNIELLGILIVSMLLLVLFARVFKLVGFEVIVATVIPSEQIREQTQPQEQTQPTLTGTLLTPAVTTETTVATVTTVEIQSDSSPPVVILTAPVKYLQLGELVPLNCEAFDDTAVYYTTIRIASPNGSVSTFTSKASVNNFSFKVTEVGNYSFVCIAEDTSNNVANSVKYLLPVLQPAAEPIEPIQLANATTISNNKTISNASTENLLNETEKNITENKTIANTTATAEPVTAESLLVQLLKRILEFFIRIK